MSRMKIDGQCHCGAIRYEGEVDPSRVIVCHCPDCQTMSGAPYRVNVPVLTANLRLEGEPARYVKTGGSGEAVITTFCGTCGTPLYSCKGDAPAFVFLRTGSVRQRAELTPTAQGFCGSAMPWSGDLSAIPVVPEPRR
jgi:hypothetical protein